MIVEMQNQDSGLNWVPTGWTPLFESIINSSVWRESKETRLVWITILAKKDRNGFVRSALWALARDAGVSEVECAKAVKVLESPDKDSACRDNAGRRIQPVDGGWLVLNHDLWRDRINRANRLVAQAAWQKEYRKRKLVMVPPIGTCPDGGAAAMARQEDAIERNGG
jgi:hypothetical protein